FFLFYHSAHHRAVHSFPTRRSSDLHGRLFMASERFFDGMLRTYDGSLQWTLRHRRFTMAVMMLTFVLTAWLFVIIPKGFIPTEEDRKSTRLNSSHDQISYAVFCLKK